MTQHSDEDTHTAEFMRLRPRLFGIAYRMLGTATEADDVVHDTWIRWQKTEPDSARDARAFLSTVTTRLAINSLSSARAQREVYVGLWLPEPVLTTDDPTLGAKRAEALDLAVLFALERLTPVERAVYVLRQAFDYSFAQIGTMLEINEADARQVAHRARVHIRREHGADSSPAERSRLIESFVAAATTGDLNRLKGLLTSAVVSYTDAGDTVTTGRDPILGADRVARYVVSTVEKLGAAVAVSTVEANGRPAVLVSHDDKPIALVTIATTPEGIQRVLLQLNPRKLTRLRQS